MRRFRLRTLIQALEKVDESLRARGVEEIELAHDQYWEIDADARYALGAPPTDWMVGSLEEDLAEIEQFLGADVDAVEEVIGWHEVTHLVPLIRYVGESQLLPRPAE